MNARREAAWREANAARMTVRRATNDAIRAVRVSRALLLGGRAVRDEARAFRERAERFERWAAVVRDVLAEVCASGDLAPDVGDRQVKRLQQSAVAFEASAAKDRAALAPLDERLRKTARTTGHRFTARPHQLAKELERLATGNLERRQAWEPDETPSATRDGAA